MKYYTQHRNRCPFCAISKFYQKKLILLTIFLYFWSKPSDTLIGTENRCRCWFCNKKYGLNQIFLNKVYPIFYILIFTEFHFCLLLLFHGKLKMFFKNCIFIGNQPRNNISPGLYMFSDYNVQFNWKLYLPILARLDSTLRSKYW